MRNLSTNVIRCEDGTRHDFTFEAMSVVSNRNSSRDVDGVEKNDLFTSSRNLKLASAKIGCQVVCSLLIGAYVETIGLLLAVTPVVSFIDDVAASRKVPFSRAGLTRRLPEEENDDISFYV